jgi:hypothetical protein
MAKLDLYEQFRPDIKSGDCLLWRSSTVIGWMIRLFTGHNVNHAGLTVCPSEHEIFKNRRFTIEALDDGIVFRLVSERLRLFSGKVWWYPLLDDYDFARDHITMWALNMNGTPYDYDSLFKQVFGRVSADMRRFFCSEFCYFAWKENGIPLLEQPAPRPGDIPALGIFKEPRLIFDWPS